MLTFDKNFYDALKTDEEIMQLTEGRIFNPARDERSEEEDSIPYIIISNDGGRNIDETKDFSNEGETDAVTISILCVAEDREPLANLTQKVRNVIREASSGWDRLQDYNISSGPVEMDPYKPCNYQTLTYQCEIEMTD